MKQIIVKVSGLSVEEKQRVNEALAKITGLNKMTSNLVLANWIYAPSSHTGDKITFGNWDKSFANKEPTHTPQQVLEMAGMAKQGHAHADLMALYAEDAKTTDKPWELWQIKVNFTDGHKWVSFNYGFHFKDRCEYRRKPKMKVIHGVEVPDIGITPEYGDMYYLADVYAVDLFDRQKATGRLDFHWASIGLCYPHTEEGKQAAILHAKAMLGIA